MKRDKKSIKDISLISILLLVVTLGLLVAAVVTSVNNRVGFLTAKNNKNNIVNNHVEINNIPSTVFLEVAYSTATDSGRSNMLVRANSETPELFKEYRYYIKEQANEEYVLDATTTVEEHKYLKLTPNTFYDVKVEAVDYNGNSKVSTATADTPKVD